MAVCRCQDDERLKDDRLPRQGRRSQERRVSGHFAPAQRAQTQRARGLFESHGGMFQHLGIGLKEEVASSVLSLRRQFQVIVAGEILDKEFMRDGGHDAGTVAISCV